MKPFLYDRLTQALLAELASGIYVEGKRFLSKRKVCRMWNVSEPTAKSAIASLCSANLIEARPRSGLILLPDFQRTALLMLHKRPGEGLPPPRSWTSKRQLLLREKGKTTRRLGLILDESEPRSLEPVDVATLQASRIFFQEAVRHEYEVEFFYQNDTPEREDFILEELQRKQVDAVTFFRRLRSQYLRPFLQRTLQLKIPVVTLFDDCESVAASSVNFNNIGAGYEATRVLLENGHRHIVVLLHERYLANVESRFEGCMLAVEESGFKSEVVLTPCRLKQGEDPKPILAKAFLREPRPTAVFASGISLFLRVLPELRLLGIKIPEDLSAIGCGNPSLLPKKNRKIDIMKFDFGEAGRCAFQTLDSLLEGRPVDRTAVLPTPYIPVGSVRRIRTP